MDITFYMIEGDSIIHANQNVKPEDWSELIDWIDIRTDDRKELITFFQKQNVYSNLRDCIEYPEDFPFSNTFGDTTILNVSISKATDIYSADHVSIIVDNTLIVTVIPKKSDLFSQRNLIVYAEDKYPSIGSFLFYNLAIKTLAQNSVNKGIARNRLTGMEQVLTTAPEDISSNDLISCERDIRQLSDIVEDQYVGFEILASIIDVRLQQKDNTYADIITKGFEPLDKSMQRLEKKAESLRLQYMLYQQEKSTRKINVLTIIQAVFVPLTFIAGVYGMNFINIPELSWPFGYGVIWLVFVAIASTLLIYFYRKGWFD